MYKLYEIHAELGRLFDELERAPTEQDRNIISNRIEAATGTWDDKLSDCCAWYKNLEAEAELIKREIERLSEMYDAAKTRCNSFKDYIAKFAPRTKWKQGVHSIGWRESTRVEIENESELPLAFKREVWKMEPDKKEIKAAIESGATVPGARLETETHIQIK